MDIKSIYVDIVWIFIDTLHSFVECEVSLIFMYLIVLASVYILALIVLYLLP